MTEQTAETRDLLENIVNNQAFSRYQLFEIRYHGRYRLDIIQAGNDKTELKNGASEGVAIRVLDNGQLGSASTSQLTFNGLKEAIKKAIKGTKVINEPINEPTATAPSKGIFKNPMKIHVKHITLEDKTNDVREIQSKLIDIPDLKSSVLTYNEVLDEKIILNNEGVNLELHDSKVMLGIEVVSKFNGQTDSITERLGRTGGYEVMNWNNLDELVNTIIERGKRLPTAKKPPAGKHVVILEPQLVRLLGHEALGHPSEADLIKGGSVLTGKIDHQLLHESITIHDDPSLMNDFGQLPGFDDEGTPAKKTTVFEKGILQSYLHDRFTAKQFNVLPTGNARAFTYVDDPLVRMTNTCFDAGDMSLDEMIEDTHHGFLLKGRKAGQADSNSEFMFGVGEGLEITNGEIKGSIRQVTISGLALDVLNEDLLGISKEVTTGYAGFCGKGQTAFTGGGGPHIKTRVTIGGK
ncbi:MAG: TldD/PmbA family protein [Candidatus Hodarchaeales archaeon]|jgi:TldD protein